MDDLSPESLGRAIEANCAELLMEMGRLGGGEQRDDPRLRWTIGGSPIDYHNCVVAADLEPAQADAAIEESMDRMRALGVPGSWHVGPSMRPADIGDRLLAAGFSPGGSEPGMAIDLHELREERAAWESLEIIPVHDVEELSVWSQTLARGFGEGEREASWVASVYREAGLGTEGPWRHFLGYLDGEPAATSTVFLGAGVAGVYFVMTVPAARGRGIGSAITLAGLRCARDLGYRVGVLASSPMGHSVYERLGFRDYCRFDLYEWSPSATVSP